MKASMEGQCLRRSAGEALPDDSLLGFGSAAWLGSESGLGCGKEGSTALYSMY
jgi:hypothetical protein